MTRPKCPNDKTLDFCDLTDYDEPHTGETCENCGLRPVLAKGRCKRCYDYRHKLGKERPTEIDRRHTSAENDRRHTERIDPRWAELTLKANRVEGNTWPKCQPGQDQTSAA